VSDDVHERIERYVENHPEASVIDVLAKCPGVGSADRELVETTVGDRSGEADDDTPTVDEDETTGPESARVQAALATAIEHFHRQIDRQIHDHRGLCTHPECGDVEDECQRPTTAREYFREVRGWNDETIDEFRLGWAPKDGREVYDQLLAKGFTREEALATGLFPVFNDGSVGGANFVGRYVLPYFNADDEPVYAIARTTGSKGGGKAGYDGHPRDHVSGKYAKLSHTKEYAQVAEPMWGLGTVRDGEPLVVAEGIADAITVAAAGYPVVSPVAKEFKREHHEALLDTIREHDVSRVYVIPDAERAGFSRIDSDDIPAEPDRIREAINIPKAAPGPAGGMRTVAFLDENDVDARYADLPLPSASDTFHKVDLDDYLHEWAANLEATLRSGRRVSAPALSGLLDRSGHVSEQGDSSAVEGSHPYSSDEYDDREFSGEGKSALYSLSITDVTPSAFSSAGDRGKNPLHHYGDSENYFEIRERQQGGLYAKDYKHAGSPSYNALTYLLVEAGERSVDDPGGKLTDREVWKAYQHASNRGLIADEDRIPSRALRYLALSEGLCDEDGLLVEDGWKLPIDAHNDVLDLIQEEYDLDPGREHIDTGRDYDDTDADPVSGDPLESDVTLEPAVAWRAVGAVTPADPEPDPDDEYERELELEVSANGGQWVCPHCEETIGLLRAVSLEEGLIDQCDQPIDDRLYDEAYRRARRTYAAPLPEYVTEETATERWDVIQGTLEQLTHWHLDGIDSAVTGQGDGDDVVAEIDPCWEDSASGQRVIAFRSGAYYCREHERVLEPVRFVALEEGIIEACDDELSGELFREAYVATRERGAPLPRWTVGNPDHHPVLPPADELVDEFETDVNALDSARGEVEDLYQQAATDASAAHLLRALPSLGKTTSAVKTAADEPTLYLGPRKELQKEVEEKAVEYGVSWMHLPVLSENSPEDDVVPAAVNVVREEGKELLRDSEDLLDRVTPDEDGDEDGNEEDGSDEPEDKAEPTEAVPTLEDAHDAGYGSLAEARQAEREVVGGGSSGGQTTDESEDEEIVLDRASCPCANGAHGEALQLAIHVARELGHSPRDIHVADKQLFGVELPCQHGGECAYSAAWTTATNPEAPIDLLIGSYGHAHVGGARTHYSTNDFDSTVLEPRTVVFDEFPGEAFAESFGEEALDHATWLASELVAQVDDRQDMIETDLWTNTWVRAWLRGEGENTITGQFHHNRLEYAVACRRVLDAADNCQHEADELLAGLDTDAPGQWKPDDLSDCLETCPAAQSNTPLEELREALTDAITALGDLAPLVGTTALLDAAGLDDAQDDEEAALGSLIDRAVEANIEGHDDASGLLDAARKTVRGGEEGCQALSVHARDPYAHPRSYLLLYGAIVKGSSDTSQIRTPSFGFDTRQAGANLKRGELDQATVLFDRNHHGAYVHDPPEFRDRAGSANPVVGLDATGRSELWSLAIGRGVEQTDIHDTDAERRAFLRDVLNVQAIQTTPHMKFYEGSTRSKNFDADIALIRAAGEEFGKQRIRADRITSTGKPGVITTKCVRNQLEEPLADDVEAMDNYGNVTGSNALMACRLGAVLGTQHYGDHTVEKWAALAGESVARTGHGTDLDYGSEIANTYLKHMSEDQTMQAILRFGRDEGGAVVFAHTAALRDEVPVVADGAVTTAFSRSAREVRDAALPYVGREEAFTVSDIEDDVECSRRSIQRALAEFAGLGYLERHEAGAGQANEFHPIADPGVGDVTPPTIDQPAEEPVDRSERRTSPDDDHSEVYYTWSVGVGARNGGGSRHPPTSTAVLPAPTATSGGDLSASHGT
jgi:hypothetical protein